MPAPAPSLSIGQLATATGVSVRSLRHYEAQGLLAAGRGTNGYRRFSASAVAQVRQLQRLLGAGFSLAEIRGFPDCMRLIEGAQACPETSAAQRDRLESLERQIGELESRRARLLQMLRESEGPGA
ncbi:MULTISPECIES: MerR family transcriptional regulator [Pseudomonas]|uniref:DNA-binding transcriptional regulator, MerR family n=1 Tax=Pseudomonas oryzihabitans TaxID=47885 RepID=A0A1G5PGF4_9PSED|nr:MULTISPECIES: MerR family transcriptional regulator [Pseudomonas]KXJ33201.1 MerR family transcriptional regulator [Pseudomonas sp. HUK17]NMY92504.1 MerR family transcriptional regulator [Pseudomonas psychrotolerans]SCZ48261.1 DNA-binding transcriptional regulator, MerR family [Pseudomonas psychrotolerans]HJE71822.1 MerR family transcriptional regulator [Pseudomonas oryzihabitans]